MCRLRPTPAPTLLAQDQAQGQLQEKQTARIARASSHTRDRSRLLSALPTGRVAENSDDGEKIDASSAMSDGAAAARGAATTFAVGVVLPRGRSAALPPAPAAAAGFLAAAPEEGRRGAAGRPARPAAAPVWRRSSSH